MLRMHLISSDEALQAFKDVNDGGHKLFPSLQAMCRANGVR